MRDSSRIQIEELTNEIKKEDIDRNINILKLLIKSLEEKKEVFCIAFIHDHEKKQTKETAFSTMRTDNLPIYLFKAENTVNRMIDMYKRQLNKILDKIGK